MVFFNKIKEISTTKGKVKNSKKGYLVCNECGGYYELQAEESPQDFVACECGGKLNHTKKLKTLPDETNDNQDTAEEAIDTRDNPDITDTVEISDNVNPDNVETSITEDNADTDDKKAKDSKVFKSKILKSIEIETGLTCPFCGTENPDHSKFCQDCGKKIAS